MPMDFPNMKSLVNHAAVVKFRAPEVGESEPHYRAALAAHVEPMDFIEAQEIRNGVGWDQFSEGQNSAMLFRAFLRGPVK